MQGNKDCCASEIDVKVVNSARQWLGTPYHFQQSKKGVGCDCLGLLRGVWSDIYGFTPSVHSYYSDDWGELSSSEELYDGLKAHFIENNLGGDFSLGDVLLFRMFESAAAKHVGIIDSATSTKTFIHAHSKVGVISTPLSSAWKRRVVARFTFR